MAGEFRLLIAGGGTGGHVFPSLAVAGAVRRARPESRMLFVGAKGGIEARLVPKAGYDLKTLSIGGLKGKGALSKSATFARLPWALFRSALIIARFGPHVVLGAGGFASGPVGLAASLLRVPLVLLEINSLAGWTNKTLSRRAREALISFPATAGQLSCPCRVVGNPVRPEVRGSPPRVHGGPLRILVLGGSQGAAGLNSLVLEALPHIECGVPVEIRHQAGAADVERVRAGYAAAGFEASIEVFIEDVAAAYRWADLVISRSGATTVAELIAARRPSILVPLPTAADNHQEYNAAEIVAAGGGEIVRQQESDGAVLASRIARRQASPSKLAEAGAALAKLDRPDSAELIAEALFEYGKGNGLEAKPGLGVPGKGEG